MEEDGAVIRSRLSEGDAEYVEPDLPNVRP